MPVHLGGRQYSLVPLDGGAFALAWITDDGPGTFWRLSVQRFDRNGVPAAPVASAARVFTTSPRTRLARTARGLLALWVEYEGGADDSFYLTARALNVDGEPLGPPTRLGLSDARPESIGVGALGNDVLVVWPLSRGGGPSLRARVVGADGLPLGEARELVRGGELRGTEVASVPPDALVLFTAPAAGTEQLHVVRVRGR
jgi:hypothetical protein